LLVADNVFEERGWSRLSAQKWSPLAWQWKFSCLAMEVLLPDNAVAVLNNANSVA